MTNRSFLFLILASTLLTSCVSPINTEYSKLPPGQWRGVLYLDESSLVPVADKEDVSTVNFREGELPFNFEVVYDNKEDFHIIFKNAKEDIKVTDITYGRDKATAKDTVQISFKEFDTAIYAIYEEGLMEGYWHVNYKDNYRIRFKAFHGDSTRFKTISNDAPEDFSGRWAARFDVGQKGEYPAIGQFTQEGSRLTGTFETETGDYRYLEGKVVKDKAWLSCFDGAHAFLFEAKKSANDTIVGLFRSGINYEEAWQAHKDENATLTDPFDLTHLVLSDEKIIINLPNPEGIIINSAQGIYQNKVKIIDIMGTWCPNCKDASIYLSELKKKYPELEIIAVAFERYRENAISMRQLKSYKEKMNLPYEITLGGYYDKAEAGKVFPQLQKIISYPTLILVDKDNRVKKIFTGFYGPASSDYTKFTSQLEAAINSL